MSKNHIGRPAQRFASRMWGSNGPMTTDELITLSTNAVAQYNRSLDIKRQHESFVYEYLQLSALELLGDHRQLNLFGCSTHLNSQESPQPKKVLLDRVFDLIFNYKIKIDIVRNVLITYHSGYQHSCRDFHQFTRNDTALLIEVLANRAFRIDLSSESTVEISMVNLKVKQKFKPSDRDL